MRYAGEHSKKELLHGRFGSRFDRGNKTLHPSHHDCIGQTLRRTARERNHAKRTAVAATLLNLQVGPCLRAHCRLRLAPMHVLNKGVRKAVVGPDGRLRSNIRRLRSARCKQLHHRHHSRWLDRGCPRSGAPTDRSSSVGWRSLAFGDLGYHDACIPATVKMTPPIAQRHPWLRVEFARCTTAPGPA